MIPKHAYHKPFTVKFPNKYEWHNRAESENKGDLVWYKDGSETNEGTGAEEHKWGLKRRYNFSVLVSTPQYSRQKYMPLRHT